jgi:hypothetical protein
LIAEGDPAQTILEMIDDGNCDMVVLGSHGHSYLRGLLLGAVHARVLHHLKRPVLIVREFREIKKALTAYRGGDCDQQAVPFIGPLLAAKNPELTIVHDQETRTKETEAFTGTCVTKGYEKLVHFGHEAKTRILKGNFEEQLYKEVTGAS